MLKKYHYHIILICIHQAYNDDTIPIIKSIVKSMYPSKWKELVSSSNRNANSSLRLYKLYKTNFVIEPYLLHVHNDKHRYALSKFRCNSHFLEIERARHQNVVPPPFGNESALIVIMQLMTNCIYYYFVELMLI